MGNRYRKSKRIIHGKTSGKYNTVFGGLFEEYKEKKIEQQQKRFHMKRTLSRTGYHNYLMQEREEKKKRYTVIGSVSAVLILIFFLFFQLVSNALNYWEAASAVSDYVVQNELEEMEEQMMESAPDENN